MTATHKTCSKCKSTQPLTAFNKCARNKDGLQSHCNSCRAQSYQAKAASKRARSDDSIAAMLGAATFKQLPDVICAIFKQHGTAAVVTGQIVEVLMGFNLKSKESAQLFCIITAAKQQATCDSPPSSDANSVASTVVLDAAAAEDVAVPATEVMEGADDIARMEDVAAADELCDMMDIMSIASTVVLDAAEDLAATEVLEGADDVARMEDLDEDSDDELPEPDRAQDTNWRTRYPQISNLYNFNMHTGKDNIILYPWANEPEMVGPDTERNFNASRRKIKDIQREFHTTFERIHFRAMIYEQKGHKDRLVDLLLPEEFCALNETYKFDRNNCIILYKVIYPRKKAVLQQA